MTGVNRCWGNKQSKIEDVVLKEISAILTGWSEGQSERVEFERKGAKAPYGCLEKGRQSGGTNKVKGDGKNRILVCWQQ